MSEPACTHPPDTVSAGPRIPRVYGTGPSEVCRCGAWRLAWHEMETWGGRWRPAADLAEALREDDER